MHASDTSGSTDSMLTGLSVSRTTPVTLAVEGALGGLWATGSLSLLAAETGQLSGDPLPAFALAFGAFQCGLGLGTLAARRWRVPFFVTYLALMLPLSVLAAASPPLLYSLWTHGKIYPGLLASASLLGLAAGAGGRLLSEWERSRGGPELSRAFGRFGLVGGVVFFFFGVGPHLFLFRAAGWLSAAHAIALCGLVLIHRDMLPRSAKAWMAIGIASATVGLLIAANGDDYYRLLQAIYFP